MAVIRTTFETLDYFPGDEEMRRELVEIVEGARQELSAHVSEVADELELHTERFAGDFEEMRGYLIDMATRGLPGRMLGSMMHVGSFENDQFHLDLPDGMDVESARTLPGHELLVRLLRLLHARVTDRACSIDKATFDRFVFRQFIAIMFVIYATTDPLLYLRPPD